MVMFAFQGSSKNGIPSVPSSTMDAPRSAIAKRRKGFGDLGKYKLASNEHEEEYGRERPKPKSNPMLEFMMLLSKFLEMTR